MVEYAATIALIQKSDSIIGCSYVGRVPTQALKTYDVGRHSDHAASHIFRAGLSRPRKTARTDPRRILRSRANEKCLM
jgi:hypothetical protein